MSTVQGASGQGVKEGSTGIVTVQFFFLSIFTVIVVTARWPDAYLPIIAALAGTAFGRERMRLPAPFWWGMGLLAWCLVGSFFSMSQAISLATLDNRWKVMLIFLVVMNAIRKDRQLWIYLLLIVGSFMIYPARGTILNYIHHDTMGGRVAWNYIYDNPNDLAGMSLLVLGAALSIAMASAQPKVVRRGSAICAVVLILVVFLTESRGGFLGLVIGIGPPFFIRAVKRPRIAVCTLVVICVGLAVLPDTLWSRVEGMKDLTSTSTFREADKYGSAEQRWQIQQTAWKITADHPLLGVGLGCYPLANNKYRPDLGKRDTHDTYLNLTAELGFPGLLIWAAIVISVLRQVRRAERRNASGISGVEPIWLKYGLFGFLIEGIFGTYSGLTFLYLVLGALWSAATLMLGDQSSKPVPS